MFADFFQLSFEFYNHIKLLVYDVIKNRQNNHPLIFLFKAKNNFSETYYSSFNIMRVKVTNLILKIRKHKEKT